MRSSPLTATLALLLGATGCHHVSMADDVDIDFDFRLLSGPSDTLHSPYVRGASVRIFVNSTDDHEKMVGWTLESSNPSVFMLVRAVPNGFETGACSGDPKSYTCNGDAWPGLSAEFQAAAAGDATVRVKDDKGNVVDESDVHVAVPERFALLAHGPLIIGHPDEAPAAEARILVGGDATFLVRWYAGPGELHGNGVLSVDAPQGVTATPETTSFLEAREWLKLNAAMAGDSTITLRADGVAIGNVPVVGVPATDVQAVSIRGVDESQAKADDWLVALAEAGDASGRAIYAIDFKWDLDGLAQQGLGDLYRYQYNPKQPRMLTAHFGDQMAQAPIHASAGFVDSSNHIGCSTGGRPGGSPFAPIALLLGAAPIVALLRRRRVA